jgi:hypothetical protein
MVAFLGAGHDTLHHAQRLLWLHSQSSRAVAARIRELAYQEQPPSRLRGSQTLVAPLTGRFRQGHQFNWVNKEHTHVWRSEDLLELMVVAKNWCLRAIDRSLAPNSFCCAYRQLSKPKSDFLALGRLERDRKRVKPH